MIQTITAGIFLTIQAIFDIKIKKLPNIVTFVGSIFGIFLMFIKNQMTISIMIAFLPAVICFFFAKISREAIGYGDVYLIGMLGFYCSITELIMICEISFMLAGIIALILLVVFRKNKQYEIPFVPFLLAGFLIEEVFI
ncbi:MAG: prepilin peptidase [Lachnospiraceae bacterium]|nr:prepilin peptidase [Lachnospiraceae bacterium]